MWWLDLPDLTLQDPPYAVVEYFAGVGRIAGLADYVGYKSAAFDIEYGDDFSKRTGKRSPMDINSNAGLL